MPEAPPGIERADLLIELANTLTGDRRRRTELFAQALAEAAGDDVRSARILSLRVGSHLWDADVEAARADARAAMRSAERSNDARLLAEAIARMGTVEGFAGEVTPGLLERGAEIETRQGLKLDYWASPNYVLARLLMRVGEIERSRGMLEELLADAAARGDEFGSVMVLWPLSMLEWLAGRWPRALEHATAAYELGEQAQHPHGRLWVAQMKALIEADLGLWSRHVPRPRRVCRTRGRRQSSERSPRLEY